MGEVTHLGGVSNLTTPLSLRSLSFRKITEWSLNTFTLKTEWRANDITLLLSLSALATPY